MPNNTTNPKVDQSLRKTKKWQEEYALLRSIALELPLTEELKWGWPCYTYEGSNIALIHGFKEYCALLLMKGALLKDPNRILVQQTENVQSARQIRFTSVDQIRRLKPTLKAYLQQAIKAEKAGLKVEFKKTAEFKVPAEFKSTLSTRPDVQKAFAALTPGRQRGYLLHFSSAKQSATREARIAKNLPRILAGKGLDDR
jgi:uncharacterized protein YdeI (YjbR/CyaY-like superfamily)